MGTALVTFLPASTGEKLSTQRRSAAWLVAIAALCASLAACQRQETAKPVAR
jgi:ABC-type transport system involved in cytochrome c biogenesis permease component